MKNTTFGAVCCALLIWCAVPNQVSAQVAHLTLNGDPGEFVSGGGNFNITYTPENTRSFLARVVGLTNGLPSAVDFTFFSDTIPNAILDFETAQLGAPLSPGNYLHALRYPVVVPGHPGLWIAFSSRGPNMITGDFTVQNAVFVPDPDAQNGWSIVRFDATFKQHAEGKTPVLRGTFSYSSGAQLPTPAATPTISISVTPSMVTEGDDAVFTVATSAVSPSVTTVRYSIIGKPRLGEDYLIDGVPGQIDIPAGASAADLVIHTIADGMKEKNQRLTVKLLPGATYKLSKIKKATFTILNGP